MKIMKLFLSLFLVNNIFAQNNNWQLFTNTEIGIQSSSITCVAEDKTGNIWIGTSGEGIFEFDGNNWVQYDTSNSPVTVNYIWTITVDSFNNKWFGTFGDTAGLIKFDNQNWTVYDLADFGIEGTTIFSIAIDSTNNLWMGTYWDGLVMFDTDSTWKIYNSGNSGLLQPQEEINCVAIDKSNRLWYGSDGWGGGMFDLDSTWLYFTNFNTIDPVLLSAGFDKFHNTWYGGWSFIVKIDSNLNITQFDYNSESAERYTCLVPDSGKVIWFASQMEGFLKLDFSTGEQWEKLFPKSYGLENIGCTGLMKDRKGNLWVGYNNGYLAVFNPEGITNIKNSPQDIPVKYFLYQNYPNPFNPTTTIKYSIPTSSPLAKGRTEVGFVSLKVYDVLGREVATLVNEKQSPGNYEVTFNAVGLPSGIYFYKLTAGNFTEAKKMVLMK